MKSKFLEQQICYTGKELAPHWIYKNFNIQGDAIVGFIGECEVKLAEMVDISDVLSNSPIYSKKMVHFIVEHFNIPLIEGVLRQRLLVNIAREVIMLNLSTNDKLLRNGDDLFYNNGKLSVSIAGKSLNSVLIHLGINIISDGAPVHAAGLKSDMNIKNHEEIARQIMLNYCKEYDEIINASCKVRGVF
ncbi:MAG TPA: DUF366 domain-containing protein [Cyanobacteria bacterium UBA9971]|nr:DUF366 domain-containing protein [Cyanobacteria bacterium UBA9971]